MYFYCNIIYILEIVEITEKIEKRLTNHHSHLTWGYFLNAVSLL